MSVETKKDEINVVDDNDLEKAKRKAYVSL
jgi:hypothetical protein